jgi:hypothetical protein
MDGFMFGSCCAHNLKDNFVLPQSTPFRPPNKPTNKYKPSKVPTSKPNKPSSNYQGTVTINRPNGSGTLVIRQPQTQHQKPLKSRPTTTAAVTTSRKPVTTKISTTSTKSPLDNFNDSSNELSASASVSASKLSKIFFSFENKKIIFFRFLVVYIMASVDRAKLHHKASSIAMGQNNTR